MGDNFKVSFNNKINYIPTSKKWKLAHLQTLKILWRSGYVHLNTYNKNCRDWRTLKSAYIINYNKITITIYISTKEFSKHNRFYSHLGRKKVSG